jgi:predicted ATPase with chaperone activity
MVEQLILKTLYFRSETSGRELAESLGVQYSVIESVVEFLKRQHLVAVRRSMGLGSISSVFALSDSGRTIAREYLEQCQYAGKIPVPLEQYKTLVQYQKPKESWLTMDMLIEAFRHMVMTPELLSAIGPAVNSGKSFLVYGQPGNGKTYMIEALFNLDLTPIYIPHAIESQGMIIQMFDPIYHVPVDAGADAIALSRETVHDRRWVRTRRPFIVSGGELDLKMLDLSYNEVARFYDAPLQLKANNGIYLIDDFGRQKVTPAEVLNRWIVPMERKIDFLTFKNGTKMHVPFETFLIFSSNLKPENLGDEAFLRRIQYKMLLKNPDEEEFKQIFRRFCYQNNLPFEEDLLESFVHSRYRASRKPKRRCHPRDILTHAMDLLRFERREWLLTGEVLDHAFKSCFAQSVDDE